MSANSPLSPALADAGVTYRRLDFWARQGYLHPEGQGGGTGYRRQWPEEELEAARRIGVLTAAGLTLAKAAEVARRDDWASCVPDMRSHPAGSASNWQARARCAETDSEIFYPEGQGGHNRHARMICRDCEVRTECLDYALEHDVEYGIWGGMTARERRRLMAARRREEQAS